MISLRRGEMCPSTTPRPQIPVKIGDWVETVSRRSRGRPDPDIPHPHPHELKANQLTSVALGSSMGPGYAVTVTYQSLLSVN